MGSHRVGGSSSAPRVVWPRTSRSKGSTPCRGGGCPRTKLVFLFFLSRRHTPFSRYVAPRFPHMSEINSLFSWSRRLLILCDADRQVHLSVKSSKEQVLRQQVPPFPRSTGWRRVDPGRSSLGGAILSAALMRALVEAFERGEPKPAPLGVWVGGVMAARGWEAHALAPKEAQLGELGEATKQG